MHTIHMQDDILGRCCKQWHSSPNSSAIPTLILTPTIALTLILSLTHNTNPDPNPK